MSAMKSKLHLLAGAAFLSFLSAPATGAILMVDLGTATSAIETGYVRQDVATMIHTVSGPASGSLTVSVPGPGVGNRDRGAIADNGAFTNGDLLRDLFSDLTRGENADTLSISGLDPNTTYTLQVFALDKNFNDGATFTFYDTTGVTTGTNSNVLGMITNSTSPAPTSNNDFSIMFNITSDATGVIEIGQVASAGNGAINGFVLAVPEPSSALLAASALLFGLARRRR